MDKKIAWEPWQILPNLPDFSPDEELDTPMFSDGEDQDDPLAGFVGIPIVPKVRTPLGYFSLDDPMSPLNMCDCWVGHTNFDIAPAIAEQIESVPGIEMFRTITRYRFFVGVAKLFNFRDVRVAINDIIHAESSAIDNELTDEEVLEVLRGHVSEFKRWAIFCSSDGFIDYIVTESDDDQEFDVKVRDFKADKKYTVITSEDIV